MLRKSKTCLMPVVLLILSFSVLCLAAIHDAASGQSGRLIIGSRNAPNDGTNQKHSEHAGDTKGYQSDQPDFTGSGLGKLMLSRWNPSVWCNKDSMSLRMQGNQVPNFLVETDEVGPVPLSKIPSHCGYSVKRARRDVSLVAKYDGCNVAQQGSNYILPLSILGFPVKMVCPVASVFCNPSAMVLILRLSPNAVKLKVNGEWKSIYQASTCGFTWNVVDHGLMLTVPYKSNCWQFQGSPMHLSIKYMDGELLLSCSAIQYTPAGSAYVAHQANPWLPDSYHPYGYGNPWYHPYGLPVSDPVTTRAPTTAAMPASDHQTPNPWLPGRYYPYGYGNPWYHPYGLPVSDPVTTRAPTTTAMPASDHQTPNPWLPGRYYPYGYGYPWYHPYGLPVSDTVTTRAPTTTAVPARDQRILNPWLAGKYHPYGYPWYRPYGMPVSDPVTTTAPTTAAPARDQTPNPWLVGKYHPYGYPWYRPYGLPVSDLVTTTAPTTTAVPARDQRILNPWLVGKYHPYGYLWYRPYGMPVSDPVTTTAPTTAAPARDQQALNPWSVGKYHPYGHGKPWYFRYSPQSDTRRPNVSPLPTTTGASRSEQLALYPGLAKMYNPSAPLDGVQQMYQIPGLTVQRNRSRQKVSPI